VADRSIPADGEVNPEREPWVRVTRADLALAARIKPIEFRVWLALRLYADAAGRCWPKPGRLAADVGVDPSGVRRGLRGLKAIGVVTQAGSVFTLHPPRDPSGRNPPASGRNPPGRNPPASGRNPPAQAGETRPPAGETHPTYEPTNEPIREPTKEPTKEQLSLGTPKVSKKGPSDLVLKLHEIWQGATGSAGSLSGKVGTKRRRDHEQALADRGFETCARLLRGLGQSDHHMQGGYIEPSYAYRATNEARFLALSANDAPADAESMSDLLVRWQAEHERAQAAVLAAAGKPGLAGSNGMDGMRVVGDVYVPRYADVLVDQASVNLGAVRVAGRAFQGSEAARYLAESEEHVARAQLEGEIERMVKREERRADDGGDRSGSELPRQDPEARP
jgi:hypothetical protein